MNNGVIVADGPTSDLLSDSELMAANRLTLPYFFDPRAAGRRGASQSASNN
jgi:cobalt/nickel transport system ATP-binding protein